jgi:segregation and condensation protein B
VSRKRGKQRKAPAEAVPEDVLAEGSGPVKSTADAITTVEDVVTTDDIATTEDVVTADDVVVTTTSIEADEDSSGASAEPSAMDVADAELAAAAWVPSVEGVNGVDGEVHCDASSENGEIDDAVGGEDGGEDDDAVVVFPTSAASMDAIQLKHLVEALIFASDRPLTVQRLRQLTRVGDVRRLEQALAELSEEYRERGLVLQQVSGGYQFRTRTQFSAWVQQLIAGRPVRLSRAQLETLAIIAYRQPITRPEIDDIRGVDSTATLKLLIDRMLIRVLGKREEVGRPMLYGTTKEFLDFFSLGDLRELPTLREYSELTAESRKVMSDRLGIAPDGGDGGNGNGGNGDGGDGDGNGGDGGGGADGNGGDGGGGSPPPGYGSGGISSGDDGEPASAAATDLSDAIAALWTAANVVDRSDVVAVAMGDDDDVCGAALDDDLTIEPGLETPVAVDHRVDVERTGRGGAPEAPDPDTSGPAMIDHRNLDDGIGDQATGPHLDPVAE